MSQTTDPVRGLTRRSFLKTTGALAGATAVLGSLGRVVAGAQEGAADSTDYQVCAATCMGNCHGMACPLDVHVKDGKAFNISKFQMKEQDLQGVCQRGYTNIERMYSPERVKYPLRRVGARGAGEWEQISWDEAISEICSKWKSLQEEYGKDSILFAKGTGASANVTVDYFDRLPAYMGATTMPLPYDQAGFYCAMWSLGLALPYTWWGTESRDLVNAKNLIVWGANPSEAATISFHHISKAHENGAQLIVIDPTFTITAAKADVYIPIRPGSDGLLAIGMMKAIIRDGRQDEQFLKQKSIAPFLVKAADGRYLRLSDLGQAATGSKEDAILVRGADGSVGTAGKVLDPVLEGTFDVSGHQVTTAYSLLLERLGDWTFDQIAELTDVPLDTIEWLAQQYTSAPTMIFTALGMDHWVNGHTAFMNIYALIQVAGQIGKSGTGVTVGDSSVQQAQGTNTSGIAKPIDAPKGAQLPAPLVYDSIFNRKPDSALPTIKSMYFWTHNPLGNLPDRKSWLEIFDAMELVVVADTWMSQSARHADIVLPVAFLWELESIAKGGNPYLRLIEAVAEPQFESTGDLEIANLLGRGMGMGDKFQMTRGEFLEAVLDNPQARSMGITWDRLKKEKRIYAYPDTVPIAGEKGFSTPTGRAQFYREGPKPAFDSGQPWDAKRESLPYWEPPHEAWYQNELSEKYPLIFMSERSKFKAHTQFWNSPMFQELDPEPYLKLNPEDARERGIETGDVIKVYNDRGYVLCKAIINPGNRKGVTIYDHGWQAFAFIEGHNADLSSRYSGNVIVNTCFFDTLCQVEKAERG